MELKKLVYIKKKFISVSARKLKCPAWLDSATFQLSWTQLGKFQLELITLYSIAKQLGVSNFEQGLFIKRKGKIPKIPRLIKKG